jgi:hypothetical protein
VPADVAAIVHPSQKETLRVRKLWQLTWQSNGAGTVETRWDLVVQALMRALVIEHEAKVIEAALLGAKVARMGSPALRLTAGSIATTRRGRKDS